MSQSIKESAEVGLAILQLKHTKIFALLKFFNHQVDIRINIFIREAW